jgi:hypothetical protein
MQPDSIAARFRAGYRRNEKKLIVAYLATLAVVVLLVAAGPVRRPVLGAAERAAAAWDDRWSRRLADAEALIEAGLLDSAVVSLEALDLQFPARHVKHARDAERQRLLRALGNTYLQLGRNDRALDAFRRLVLFEPRSYANYFDLARACLEAGEEAEAQQHLAAALAINPTHLPTVRTQLRLYYGVRDFKAVVAAYEAYLRAFMVQELTVAIGATRTTISIPVDAHEHEVPVLVAIPPNVRGLLTVEAGGLPVEVEQVTMQPPTIAGASPLPVTVLQPPDAAWMFPGATGDSTVAAVPEVKFDSGSQGIEGLVLRVRLRKPVDPALWSIVERSYRSLLDTAGLERARVASVVMKNEAAADAVRRPE